MLSISGQIEQYLDVLFVITGLVYRGFGDKCAMSKAFIVQQAAERLQSDGALADVFMASSFDPRGALASFICQTRTS